MTFTKNLQWFAIVFLLLMTTLLSAQGNYEASPTNYVTVAQDIAHHYPGPISIPVGDIETFLLNAVTVHDPCNGCGTPQLEVLASNDQEIKLTWPAVPETHEYQIKMLNLNTGNISFLNTDQTQVTISGKPNGFYAISLVAFVKENGVLKSSIANIIILEKPVLMPAAYDGTSCGCLNKTPVAGSQIFFYNFNNTAKVKYQPVANHRYFLLLEGAGGNGPSSLIYTAEQENLFQPIAINIDCLFNIPTDQSGNDNTIWGPENSNGPAFSIKIDPSDYTWTITGSSLYQINHIEFYRCIPLPGSEKPRDPRIGQTAERILQIYPNPAIDQLTIKQDIALDRPAELRITNTLGQVLHLNNNFSGKEMLLTSRWPAGTYIATVAQNGKYEQQSFTVIK